MQPEPQQKQEKSVFAEEICVEMLHALQTVAGEQQNTHIHVALVATRLRELVPA
jgi:hypothetical protein